jgi:hypothetical protein
VAFDVSGDPLGVVAPAPSLIVAGDRPVHDEHCFEGIEEVGNGGVAGSAS